MAKLKGCSINIQNIYSPINKYMYVRMYGTCMYTYSLTSGKSIR